jgi:hypothetical protein
MPTPDPVPANESRIVPVATPEPSTAVHDDRPVQHRLFVALWLLVVAGGLAAAAPNHFNPRVADATQDEPIDSHTIPVRNGLCLQPLLYPVAAFRPDLSG